MGKLARVAVILHAIRVVLAVLVTVPLALAVFERARGLLLHERAAAGRVPIGAPRKAKLADGGFWPCNIMQHSYNATKMQFPAKIRAST